MRRRVDDIIRRIARFTQAFSSSWPAGLLLALALAGIAALPLFLGPGLLNTRGGGDSPFLLQRVQQLSITLAAGHFPVRWMPDANYGYGYPFFHYYAPLSLYAAALFHFLGASYVLAIRFGQLAAFLLAAGAAYTLGRRWLGSDAAGLLAAAAYTLAPFHLVNVYVRGDSLAEFWAMAFFPLVLLAAEWLLTAEGRARWPAAAVLGLSYAGLILSHNISALIFSPFLLLFLALRLRRHPNRHSALLAAAGALSWGLALSAWFWLPALAETELAQTGPITAGYFHFANHFRSVDLVQGSLLFSYDVSAGGAFRMGLLQVVLVVAGLLSLWLVPAPAGERPGSLPVLFLVTGLLLATAMITPLSRLLWEHLPLLPYTQFPWRFLSVQAFFGAMVAAGLTRLPLRRWWLPALLLLLLGAALGGLRPAYLPVGDEDVTAERLAAYEWFSGNIGTTVSAEYLPQTVKPRPYSSRWLVDGERDGALFLQGTGAAPLLERQPTRQRWQVAAGAEGATVLLPVLHWPGWRATLDGIAWPIAPATGSGLIAVEAPAGEHELLLSFGRTPLRAGSELASLAALLAVLPALWLARARLRTPLLASLVGALLLAGVFALWPAPPLDAGTLSWDFAQAAYLHHAPDGIPFAGEWRLRHYEYAAETVSPGADWTISLEWEGERPPASSVTVALATPAANRFAAAPLLAVAEAPLQAGQQAVTLRIPDSAPAGLYLPRVTIVGAPALMSNGETRGDLFLRPLQVSENGELEPTPGAPLAARASTGALEGPAPAVTRDPPGLFDCTSASETGRLRLALGWYTAKPLGANLVASLRLSDAAGRLLAQCDVQPGYGFQPSLAWRAGGWTDDLLALPLPETLPDASPYILAVHLYDGAGVTRLTQRLGTLDWSGERLVFAPSEPQFVLPEGLLPANGQFGDAAALRGYGIEQDENSLVVTLYWEALGPERESLVRFVQLLGDDGQIARRPDGSTIQVDSLPQGNSYPTSQWTSGEIVADGLHLSLEGVPPGPYELVVGFYQPSDDSNRLPVTLPDGTMPLDRVVRLSIRIE